MMTIHGDGVALASVEIRTTPRVTRSRMQASRPFLTARPAAAQSCCGMRASNPSSPNGNRQAKSIRPTRQPAHVPVEENRFYRRRCVHDFKLLPLFASGETP